MVTVSLICLNTAVVALNAFINRANLQVFIKFKAFEPKMKLHQPAGEGGGGDAPPVWSAVICCDEPPPGLPRIQKHVVA